MQQNSNFPNISSQQPKESFCSQTSFLNNINSQLSQNDSETRPNFQNKKLFTKPIGIYNFNSNKNDISSLEDNVNEVVSSFIEKNKENIIKYVINEVDNKLNEKIKPLNTEIINIKNSFNSLYNQEIKEFKELDILNDCHNNIVNINNKVNIMNENINNYNNEIKGFNICDNRLKFLNKLNNDLQEFINGINTENEKNMEMDIEEESHKIDIEQKKQNCFNQELDNIFNDTMSMLKGIGNNNNYNEKSNNNGLDAFNNLKNTINDFEMKFNYEKPYLDEKKQNNNSANNDISFNKNNYNDKKNIFDGIPEFFDF